MVICLRELELVEVDTFKRSSGLILGWPSRDLVLGIVLSVIRAFPLKVFGEFNISGPGEEFPEGLVINIARS